jgi:MFS family permease
VTQFTTNGLSFAGQMMIPVYLIRAACQSPVTTGWLMALLGLGMMCSYRWMQRLTQQFGIRRTSTGGALIAFLGTLPLLYLSSHRFDLPILAISLFVRGIGMGAVGILSISAAHASVRKEELPMATTSLNIVQRLGGPTLTTICASFLGWRLAATRLYASVSSAFTVSFALLCGLHALLILAATRLPLREHLNGFDHFKLSELES